MRRFRSLFLIATALAGCAPTTLGAPNCPNPVLVGPIDRVGARAPQPTKTLGAFTGESGTFVSVSSEQRGNVKVTTTTVLAEGTGVISERVMAETQGRPERDVRIESIDSGAYFFLAFGVAMSERWAKVRARVVEVDHAR